MQQHSYSTIAAASAAGVNPTTVQRAIQRGELKAERHGTSRQARYQISPAALAEWAAANGLTITTGNGQVDPATGEVLESAQLAEDRSLRINGRFGPVAEIDGEVVPMPAAPTSNVAAVVLPPAASVAADRLSLLAQLVKADQLEAARIVITHWGL
jgi:hypothetical protein